MEITCSLINALHTVGYFLPLEQPNTLQHPLVRRFGVQCPMTATHHQPVGTDSCGGHVRHMEVGTVLYCMNCM